MIRITPTADGLKHTLPLRRVGDLIAAVGTERYAGTCLDLLDEHLDVDHWALFHYRPDSSLSCVASASRAHMAAARANVRNFIDRCHRVDPSLIALRRQHSESACITEMQASDIRDQQYRQCFEVARVKERVSYYVRVGPDLHQLSIYRRARYAPLSPAAIAEFAALASVIVTSGTKHEALLGACAPAPDLDIGSLERLLRQVSTGLSRREVEVCARAAAGSTIDATAIELNIQRTSVVTYRQRAYQKLNVSRQSELLALIHRLRPSPTLPEPPRRSGAASQIPGLR